MITLPRHNLRVSRAPFTRVAGFTLTELMIVIVIIVILAAISFPVVARVRAKGESAKCINNLRQIGIGMQSYVSENNGRLPHGLAYYSTAGYGMSWYDSAAENLGREFLPRQERAPLPDVFGCPSGHGEANWPAWPYTGDYAYNFRLGRDAVPTMASVKRASSTPWVQDTVHQNNFGEWIFGEGGSKEANMAFADRHGGKGNILWLDGHVSSFQYEEYMEFARDPRHNGPFNFVRGRW